ncbi:MAG TPA: glycogen debranching enzyme N-terminal domain-containing protein, partial [Thermoanaerobaculia bacterium]
MTTQIRQEAKPAVAEAEAVRLERRMPWSTQTEIDESPAPDAAPELLLNREWLVTNGLGGYASGTLSGVATRRYHGLLVSALPAPVGRILMLCQMSEVLRLPDHSVVTLGGEVHVGKTGRKTADGQTAPGNGHLRELRLEAGMPVWRYEAFGYVLEKRVFLAHLQNTVFVRYTLREGPGVLRLEMHPSLHVRPHDAPVSTPLGLPFSVQAVSGRYEINSAWAAVPPLRLRVTGANPTFTVTGRKVEGVYYELEDRRGYEPVGDLWVPGFFAADLAAGDEAALIASTEAWEVIEALNSGEALESELERRERLLAAADPRAQEATPAELVLASDQFVVIPGRSEDAARAHAAGDESKSVIAGYHWFTDWGRDTMISLEGLTLTTGRHLEAGYILRSFARHVRDGLIPNYFPEGDRDGVYHTADATLWYFHALDRYLEATGDTITLDLLLPVLVDIVDHHLRGTR